MNLTPFFLLGRSQIKSKVDIPGGVNGQRFVVEAIDSPGFLYARDHQGFMGNAITQATIDARFRVYLAVWTNANAIPDASEDAANRLYSIAMEYDWSVAATYNINNATETATAVGNPAVNVSIVSFHTPAVPAIATGIEVRGPLARNVTAFDFRT